MLEMETKLTNFIKSIKMQSVISIDRVFVVLVYDLFSRWLDSRRMYAAVVDGGSLPAKHLTRPGYIFVFLLLQMFLGKYFTIKFGAYVVSLNYNKVSTQMCLLYIQFLGRYPLPKIGLQLFHQRYI